MNRVKQGYVLSKLFGRTEEIPSDWEILPFEKILKKMKSGVSRLLTHEDIGYPVLRSTNIVNGKFDPSEIKYWHLIDTKCADLTKYHLEEGDIILNFINSLEQIGKSCIFHKQEREWIFTTNVLQIKIEPKKVNLDFFFFLINSHYFKEQIRAITQPAVNQASFSTHWLKKLKVFIPKISEQQKISSILTDIDSEIELVIKEIKETQKLMLGVAQKLMRNGIRHKKYKKIKWYYGKKIKIPEEWDTKKLGEICNEIYRYPTYYGINYVKEGISEIRGELIKTNGTIDVDFKKIRHISKETAEKFPRTSLKENDIVFSVRGTMGKVALVPKQLEGSNITANLMRISTNRSIIEPKFLLYFMLDRLFKNRLDAISPQTTIKTIQSNDLQSIVIFVPKIKEQQEIVSILEDIEKQIFKLEEKKKALEKLKKGLMQKLLTGTIRVKV